MKIRWDQLGQYTDEQTERQFNNAHSSQAFVARDGCKTRRKKKQNVIVAKEKEEEKAKKKKNAQKWTYQKKTTCRVCRKGEQKSERDENKRRRDSKKNNLKMIKTSERAHKRLNVHKLREQRHYCPSLALRPCVFKCVFKWMCKSKRLDFVKHWREGKKKKERISSDNRHDFQC